MNKMYAVLCLVLNMYYLLLYSILKLLLDILKFFKHSLVPHSKYVIAYDSNF